jgi:hypothetical protein
MLQTKIHNNATSTQEMEKNSLKIKILNSNLPTLDSLHEAEPALYKTNICPRCKTHKETQLHFNFCPSNQYNIRDTIKLILEKLILKKKNANTARILINHDLKNINFLKIDPNRIDNPEAKPESRFSITDTIRGLIPKSLFRFIKRHLTTDTKEIKQIVRNFAKQITEEISKRWSTRMTEIHRWERENNIDKEKQKYKWSKKYKKELMDRNQNRYELELNIVTKTFTIESSLDSIFSDSSYINNFIYDVSEADTVETY